MKILLTCLVVLSFLICEGQNEIDSLEAIIMKDVRDIPTARAYNLLASKYARTNPGKSKNYAGRAYKLGEELNHPLTKSASLSIYVSYFQNAGVEDSAKYFLRKLEKLASEVGNDNDNFAVKGNYHSTAGLYFKRIGNVKQALPHFKASIDYTEKAGRKLSVAGQSLNLANTYLSLGSFKEALHYYFKAEEKFEELGNKEGLSFCQQGIGNSFVKLKQFEKARVYLNKSFEIKKMLGDKKGLVTAYVSLGQLAADTKDNQSAISYFTEALELARQLKIVTEERDAAFNLGKVYSTMKDNEKAEKFLLYSKKLAVESGDDVTRSAAEMELIALRDKSKSKDSSENELKTSITRLISLGDADQTLSGYLHLAQLYEENGDYEKALIAKQNYYDLRDSIKGNEMMVSLRDMEAKYNSEKKEREIAELKRDQILAEIQLKEQKTLQYGLIGLFAVAGLIGFLLWNRYKLIVRSKRQAELEKVRNNIARDLHDDIGSTLSSINILSKVMLDSKGPVNVNSLQKIKEHSGSIMESMGDIVWAINPMNDTFEKLVMRMKEFATDMLEPLKIRYSFEIDPSLNRMKIDPARKKEMFLIFKECINNAAKYSDCTDIRISIMEGNKLIAVSIADNGIGMDVNMEKGNGLRNIHSRVASLSGDAKINSSPGNGTEIIVKLPVT